MSLTSTAPDGIDRQAVERWLAEHAPTLRPPFEYVLIAGGRSNLTFRGQDAGGRRFVLRRPPLGTTLESAHDMGREHRVLSALAPTPVPVPAVLALCDDPSVNGAPFYVMEHLDGPILRDAVDVEARYDEAERTALTHSLIDTLAAIHLVDPDAVGLGTLGRREDYLGRQLRRWQRQYDEVKAREIPQVEEAHRRLVARQPSQQRDALVHGDYRIDNVAFSAAAAAPPHVAGVLDWELCTLGDPLADLGGMFVHWMQAGESTDHMLWDPPSRLPGFPTREQLAERYAARTGFDLSGIAYYEAFAYWRMACISEGVYARFRDGAMGEQEDAETVDRLGALVVMLADRSLELLP
jgi:aminoglycoside phosphotransferase (APT) family kinase protein